MSAFNNHVEAPPTGHNAHGKRGFQMKIMEDSVDVILQDKKLHPAREKPVVMAASGAMLMASYALWTVFALPGFRKVPTCLKVPYLPSSGVQTQNVLKLLQGRGGCLADLGSGDGRLVFAASSLGFQCTGFEINSILIGYARARARWRKIPTTTARFVNEDFWKTDLSRYKTLTVFLAPGVMEVLGRKLEQELAHDARVIACRFPFPHWHASASEGQGIDQAWAYDMATVRKLLE
ncbi:ATP synthase subunit C lysine N-methyltransferase isoform X1 [Silurus meridionalis]|nr:ATP synthase subunit C lysine N-methyltransferase isoform X1 [Silurus meridionalis]